MFFIFASWQPCSAKVHKVAPGTWICGKRVGGHFTCVLELKLERGIWNKGD